MVVFLEGVKILILEGFLGNNLCNFKSESGDDTNVPFRSGAVILLACINQQARGWMVVCFCGLIRRRKSVTSPINFLVKPVLRAHFGF